MIKVFKQVDSSPTRIDVVIGCGLIGEALCEAIRQRPYAPNKLVLQCATDWSKASSLEKQLVDMRPTLQTLRESLHAAETHFYWCAGRAGFSATEDDIRSELSNFERVLRWAEQHTALSRSFHMLSSAGGLHEGQTRCDDPSRLQLSRPYARLKRDQEVLLEHSTLDQKFIYRLSSVFGLAKPGQRFGLIPTIIQNGLNRRTTTIFADASTQRDFISSTDVATFIANDASSDDAFHDGEDTRYYYLASGIPCTIWEIHMKLERLLSRDIAVNYTVNKDNFQSTTFSPSMLPEHWRCHPVQHQLGLLCHLITGKPGI